MATPRNGSAKTWAAAIVSLATVLTGSFAAFRGVDSYRLGVENRIKGLTKDLAELEEWRDKWRDRVIPLDDDQTDAIETLLDRINSLEAHMDVGARYPAQAGIVAGGCLAVVLRATRQLYVDRERGAATESRPGIIEALSGCVDKMERQVDGLLERRQNGP